MADSKKLAQLLMSDLFMKKTKGGSNDYVIQSPNQLPNDYVIQSPNPVGQDNSPYIARNPYALQGMTPEQLNQIQNWGNAQKLKQMYEMQDRPEFQNLPVYK